MKDKEQLTTIWKFIIANGIWVTKAQSAWGADCWELDCELGRLAATLEDDGYTRVVIADGLIVRSTCGHELNFSKGNEGTLFRLFVKIINLPLDKPSR
jgi:hypothetical protein